jgi:hypothetical protein
MSVMTKEQIKANFKSAHGKAVENVAAAQYVQMEAAANLANARKVQRDLEKQFRDDMAAPDTSDQLSIPFDGKKK